MWKQRYEIVKNQIAERRRRLTPEELLKENYSMVVRIGEEIFRCCKDSYNYYDDTRCFDFAEFQLEQGLYADYYIDASAYLNYTLSDYDIIIFRDVITSFYGIPLLLCECIFESKDYDVVSIAMMILNSIEEMKASGVFCKETIKNVDNSLRGEYNLTGESFDLNNGRERMKDFGKHKKDPRKNFKNNNLIPLRAGEVRHHLTDNIIVGIPKEVHERLSGYDQKTHRKKVLEWLDEQAEKAKIAHAYLVLDEEEK